MRTKKSYKSDLDRQSLSQQRQAAVAAIRWSWFDSIGYQPHRYQVCFHNSWTPDLLQYVMDNNLSAEQAITLVKPARHRTCIAGRRGGKSESAGHEGSAYMVSGNYKILIGAPSYDLGYHEFKIIRDDLMHEDSPVEIVELGDNKEGGNLKIVTDIGSECIVASFDKPKKSAHGAEFDLIILSETALMDNIGGDSGIWNKTLVGAMATRQSETIAPTTPQGRDDWLFPRFIRGCKPDSKWRSVYGLSENEYPYDPDYFSLTWPAYANTFGFNEDVLKLKKELPSRIFDEQVLGHFVKWSGSCWVNDFCYDPNINVIDSFSVPSWWSRIEVIDPGFSGQFAWIAAVASPKGDLFIVDEYKAQRTLYETHIADIMARRRMFYKSGYDPNRFIPVYVDPEDPRIVAEFNAKGLTCIAADNDVMGGFQQGAFRFSQGTLSVFKNCKSVMDSLQNHQWAKQTGEATKRKEANDSFKHFSDCVRYLCSSPIWPSEAPKENVAELPGWAVRDIMNSLRKDVDVSDLSFNDWAKMHG
jgi:hypothetical protein